MGFKLDYLSLSGEVVGFDVVLGGVHRAPPSHLFSDYTIGPSLVVVHSVGLASGDGTGKAGHSSTGIVLTQYQ